MPGPIRLPNALWLDLNPLRAAGMPGEAMLIGLGALRCVRAPHPRSADLRWVGKAARGWLSAMAFVTPEAFAVARPVLGSAVETALWGGDAAEPGSAK